MYPRLTSGMKPDRSPGNLREQRSAGARLRRGAVAAGLMFLLLALSTQTVLADCVDTLNGKTYCSNYSGCGATADIFETKVATQSGPCYWSAAGDTYCPYVYDTQGGKTNLSTAGNPFTWDSANQHVAGWITSFEGIDHGCVDTAQAGACWVQVGWTTGYGLAPTGCNPRPSISTGTAIDVFVEIYDDSSNPCLLATFGSAPSNASYDARYYAQEPNGLYRYQVYFEVPGSNNIQDLAYGDLVSQSTVEMVAGEAFDQQPSGSGVPDCPDLGQTYVNEWDIAGQPASQATFASYMNLYQGGQWKNWTTSVAPTLGYLWPPNGHDSQGHGNSTNPYLFQAISNWSGGDYTEWEFGGPTN